MQFRPSSYSSSDRFSNVSDSAPPVSLSANCSSSGPYAHPQHSRDSEIGIASQAQSASFINRVSAHHSAYSPEIYEQASIPTPPGQFTEPISRISPPLASTDMAAAQRYSVPASTNIPVSPIPTATNISGHVIPPAPQRFEQLQRMSVDELRRLAQNDAAFEEFMRQHPYRRNIESILNTAREQVEQLRTENAVITEELARLESAAAGASLEEQLAEEQRRLKEAQEKLNDWLSRNSPAALAEQVQEAVEDARLESEDLVRMLHEGEILYSEFIDRYIESRRKYHERKIKLSHFNHFRQRTSS